MNAMLGMSIGAVYAVWIMRRATQICTMLWFFLAWFSGAASADTSWSGNLLAGMPILEPSMTRIELSHGAEGPRVFIDRSLAPRVILGASASLAHPFDLHAKLYAPIHVAPAFLAVDVSTRRIAGLMTLFFGPVSIDLGRAWIESSRWAFVQLIVHPRLALVIGGIERLETTVLHVGWRLFPAASAQWEVDLSIAGNEIRLAVGGVL